MPDFRSMARVLTCAALVGVAAPAAMVAMTSTAARAQPDDSRAPRGSDTVALQASQTVDITIGRWDPVEETFVAWENLGGEFRIGAGGDIVLPMVGRVSVLGLTASELGDEISTRLQETMGLQGRVQAGVKIIDYGEIYVLGDVKVSGAHPFEPGMTVLQALGLAGGVNGVDTTLLRGERTALTSLGSYKVLQLEALRRLATLARLNAELEGRDIEVPELLARAEAGTALIEQEREIKNARDAAYRSSLSQLDDLETLLRQSIESLDRQLELRSTQLELLETELENASSLVEQGLSTASRQSGLERQVADQQVRELELSTARLTVQQDLNEASRDRLELVNSRRRQLVEDIQVQRAAIDELQVKMETEAALYAESVRTGTGILQLGLGDAPELVITRREGGETETFGVVRSDEVRSGDVIEVLLPEIGSFDSLPMLRFEGAGADLPETLGEGTAPQATQPAEGAVEPPA